MAVRPDDDVPLRRLAPVQALAVGVLLEDLDGHGVVLELDDAADLDVVDGAQQRALAHHLALREVELAHGAREAVGAVGRVEPALRDPRVLEAVVDGDALVDVDREHAVDEVERRVADRVPVRRRVVEPPELDLLRQVVRVLRRLEFIREGREAAEADVKDDAERPDVHGARVLAVPRILEYLWRDICDQGLVWLGGAERGVTVWMIAGTYN